MTTNLMQYLNIKIETINHNDINYEIVKFKFDYLNHKFENTKLKINFDTMSSDIYVIVSLFRS